MNGQTIAVVHGNNVLSIIVVVVVDDDNDDDGEEEAEAEDVESDSDMAVDFLLLVVGDVVSGSVSVVRTTSAVMLLSLYSMISGRNGMLEVSK